MRYLTWLGCSAVAAHWSLVMFAPVLCPESMALAPCAPPGSRWSREPSAPGFSCRPAPVLLVASVVVRAMPVAPAPGTAMLAAAALVQDARSVPAMVTASPSR